MPARLMRDLIDVLVFGIVAGTIYALIALSVVMTYRGSRVINLALVEVGTGGLFVSWWLWEKAHVPYVIACGLGVAAGVTVGVLFERLVVARMADAERLAVSVATVGVSLAVFGIENIASGQSPRSLRPPVHGIAFRIDGAPVLGTQVFSLAVAVTLALLLTNALRRSDFGLAVLAAAQDPDAVRLVGAPLWRVSAFTWGAGCGLAVIAMILSESTVATFVPGFGGRIFVLGLIGAVVGGLGDLRGAVVGGLAVGLAEAAVNQWVSPHVDVGGVSTVTVGGVLLAVLLLRPQGLLTRAAR
ncbi:MAG TPA: branched-chain amino acid ABC transporter permease [Mycobacteriales bacterium]|nr:branched-chain amino acid ABC transporter permease [Mycobacteriales bacterium]